MDKTGTYNMVNRYTESLKKSSMTQKVNKLHKMCLMPFLKDLLSYEGRLRKYVTEKDKILWGKFLSCCYAGLKFEDASSMIPISIYIGYSDAFPNESIILDNAIVYPTDNVNNLISNRVMGHYFWIALPSGYSLERADNLSVNGDYIKGVYFKTTNITIRNGNYRLYYIQSTVPLKSMYKIIVR